MKTTTKPNFEFPSVPRLIAVVVLIAGLGFLSCLVSHSQISHFNKINIIDKEYIERLVSMEPDESETEVAAVNYSSLSMDHILAFRLEMALTEETEEEMDLESWMLSDERIGFDYDYETWELIFIEDEEGQVLEDWMTGFIIEEKEEELELEEWMMNKEYWK